MADRHTVEDLVNFRYVPDVVAPSDQTSTNTFAAVTGSVLDTYFKLSVAYTIKNVHGANSIDVRVVGANVSDFSDAVVVNGPTTLAAAAITSYTVSIAPYRYYRVEEKATVNDTQGTARVRGIAKG